MAGRYPGGYPGRSGGWRAAAILADTGRASPVERIPQGAIIGVRPRAVQVLPPAIFRSIPPAALR